LSSTPLNTSFRRAELFASAEQVPAGHPLSLDWKVVGADVAVSSVQLACASENGLEVIESMPDQGVRQIIFARPGLFTFTLTVIFQDGVRRSKQIRVRVTD
jgi:hypothetical protein